MHFLCSLDDDIWEIRFNFPGQANYLERFQSESDITVLNLLAMIEGYGYGIKDNMYYVKEKGKGQNGMEVIDSMVQVKEMLAVYEKQKILNITVLKKNATWPIELNIDEGEGQLMNEVAVISVDRDGVNYISHDEDLFPVAMDLSEVVYVGTQQSCNFQKDRCSENIPVDVISSDDDEQSIMVEEEVQLLEKFKRQKKEREPDPAVVAIMEKLTAQKKQRENKFLHFKGDTDVEEFFEAERSEERRVGKECLL